MVGKFSKSHGEWDGKKLDLGGLDNWDGKVDKWIHDGKDLKLLYEDLRKIQKRIKRGLKSALDVKVTNHDYEDGKSPMIYVAFERVNGNLRNELDSEFMKGLREYDIDKKDTPFNEMNGVKVLGYNYDVEDYKIV